MTMLGDFQPFGMGPPHPDMPPPPPGSEQPSEGSGRERDRERLHSFARLGRRLGPGLGPPPMGFRWACGMTMPT